MKREAILRACASIAQNGLDGDAEIFTGSEDEWLLREAAMRWQQENLEFFYGTESPQPGFVRAMLAFGNLRLIQREFL